MKLKLLLPIVVGSLILIACNIFSVPNVSVSGDGQWLAFLLQSDTSSLPRLFAQNLNSLEVIAFGSEGHIQGGFDWHPNSKQITFFDLAPDGTASICSATIEEPRGWLVARLNTGKWVERIAYSPDGTMLALQEVNLSYDDMTILMSDDPLALAPIQQNLFQGANNPVGVGRGEISWLTLESGERQFLSEVATELTWFNVIDWNHDSSKLAYVGLGANNSLALYIYDFSTNSTRSLASTAGLNLVQQSVTALKWLDEQTLLLSGIAISSAGSTNTTRSPFLMQIDVNTGVTIPLAAPDGYMTSISISPDGQWIAFVELDASSEESVVKLLSIVGDEGETIYRAQGLIDEIVWAPDSTELYLSNGNAYAAFDGNEPQQIARLSLAQPTEPEIIFSGDLITSHFTGYLGVQTVTQATPGAQTQDQLFHLLSTPGPTPTPDPTTQAALGSAAGTILGGLLRGEFSTPVPTPTFSVDATIDAAFNQAMTATAVATVDAIAVTAAAAPRSIPCG